MCSEQKDGHVSGRDEGMLRIKDGVTKVMNGGQSCVIHISRANTGITSRQQGICTSGGLEGGYVTDLWDSAFRC